MSGKEFVDKLLKAPQFKSTYDENGYFKRQIDHLREIKEIHTQDLIFCMICLSNELTQKDIDMIDNLDQGYLRKDVYL